MRDPIRINIEYLASTYGLQSPVTWRVDSGVLVLSELEPQVAIDLDTIRSIGETNGDS